MVSDRPAPKKLRESEVDDGAENPASSPRDPGRNPEGQDCKDTTCPAEERKDPEPQQEETPGTVSYTHLTLPTRLIV